MKDVILLVNGPNLNMLGVREPDKYGNISLAEIIDKLDKDASGKGYSIKSLQSNHEGEIIDFIQTDGRTARGMILNAGAFTHTSVAIRDAILSVKLPFIEVHLSNIFAREEFRKNSYLSDIAVGVISGFGENSYYLGLTAITDYISKKNKAN
jgi:3-dehydroquinate dehydratase II